MKTHVPVTCRDLTYIAQVDDLLPWSLDDLVAAIKNAASNHASKISGRPSDYYTIAGCMAGGEAGVDMADLLSEKLGVLSNGAKGDFANRRDKKVQVSNRDIRNSVPICYMLLSRCVCVCVFFFGRDYAGN